MNVVRPLVALAALASVCASAELTVVKDYGGTRPTGLPTMGDVQRLARQMDVPTSEIIPTFSPYTFPLESELMSLGNLGKPIVHGKSGIQPFFIIGADEHSKAWIKRNKQYLIDQSITRGLITDVPNAAAFQALVDAAAPLQLYALNTDEVAKVLGVHVYPIVINKEEISQ